jgi:hypothetical protein
MGGTILRFKMRQLLAVLPQLAAGTYGNLGLRNVVPLALQNEIRFPCRRRKSSQYNDFPRINRVAEHTNVR